MNFTSKNFEASPSTFVGQGDLVMFSRKNSYESADTLANLLSPTSLGQIVQDSTSWDGDDVEVTQIKDEQGNVISAKTTAGTIAFSFELSSTSRAMVAQFLKGTPTSGSGAIAAAALTGSGVGWTGLNQAVGFGTDLPVMDNIPMAILNDTQTRAFIYPKCKIASNLSYSDGLWRIKASVTAEQVKTAGLRTGMIVDYVAAI